MNFSLRSRRILVALAILIAVPYYVFCGLTHVCFEGHMQHPPYPFLCLLNDAIWLTAFTTACVFIWKSDCRFRKTSFFIILLLFTSRIPLGSGGMLLFIIELPLLIVLTTFALMNLFRRSSPAPSPKSAKPAFGDHLGGQTEMLPSWEEIRLLEIEYRFPEAIAALETRLSGNPVFEPEVIIRLGFNLWLGVEKNIDGPEEPYRSYALRFVELLRTYHDRLIDNADFCWAFGQGIDMFWHYFPGTTRAEGQALIARAGQLDDFWAHFWDPDPSGAHLREAERRFHGRGIFERYYNTNNPRS